jgi:hypothetical protein
MTMEEIAQSLADPGVRGLYLGFCLALLILPMVALWLWYRKRAKEGTVDKSMVLQVGILTLAWMAVNAAALGLVMWANTVAPVATG